MKCRDCRAAEYLYTAYYNWTTIVTVGYVQYANADAGVSHRVLA